MKKRKLSFFICFIFAILSILSVIYFDYSIALLNNIEDLLRLIISILFPLITFIFVLLLIRFFRKRKKGKLIFIIFLMVIFSAIEIFAGYNIQKVYGALKEVSDTSGMTTYSSSLVTLSGSSASSISDVSKDAIGILSDKTSYEGYIIPKDVLSKNNLKNVKEYDSYIGAIDDLLSGKIKYIFLPTNYSVMFGSMDGYADIKDKTKIILTEKKEVKKEKSEIKTTNSKKITEPFTVLLMGVDSEEEEIKSSSFNGDSLMVITFNPTTLSTTILSIPRDSYVPIACFNGQRKNKITHAAWKGEECMINTIQNFLDVKIDYYVKINFKGVVKLVDTLGGVSIDVPYNLCEQDSSRRWGEYTVYIEKGLQNLSGEQALAYARNRHPNPSMCSSKWTNYVSNDFIRGQHQQEIVESLLNKFKDISDLNTVYKLLDTISASMTTNMSTDQILSLYNVFKDVASKSKGLSDMSDVLGMQRLYLNGYDARIVDYGGTNLSLYNYVLYDSSVKEVSNAMRENLGIKKVSTVKKFSFDVNTPYEKTVIGKNTTGAKSLVQVPNFVGQSVSYASSFCSSHGISVSVKGGNGVIISQSVPSGANVEDVKSIVLTAGGGTDKKDTSTNDISSSNSSNKGSSTNNTNTTDKKDDGTKKEDSADSSKGDGSKDDSKKEDTSNKDTSTGDSSSDKDTDNPSKEDAE